ncbi:hypothetical protein EL22_11615 [Halostagnicola sp. A56]|uniref:sugar transferase n=1 Tax=Halostagnicola sp. A56 TaxID=1495067 RepID=UPI0004A0C7BA|nr:hypothetical protein EL22_11615 [Halostagnicola sp. A56]
MRWKRRLANSLGGDERATHIDRIVRKTRLEEISQFWLILRVGMSVVGSGPPESGSEKQNSSIDWNEC